MAGNTFGDLFRVTTFGESHGDAIGCVIDGCPSNMELSVDDIQPDLNLRKPGQSSLTTQRSEDDNISILSGVFEDRTLGTPILLISQNKDQNSQDYELLKDVYRPSHADYTYQQKYGIRDWRGGGRASARETLARVAAGAVAKKYLKSIGIEFLSFVDSVGQIKTNMDPNRVTAEDVESSIVRCPDPSKAKEMIALIEKTKNEGDSLGGTITGIIKNVPIGLGEPVFDKLHAELGKAMLSINAAKGFEIGAGFKAAQMKGSDNNDPFYIDDQGKIKLQSNNAGGVLGGISSGENIVFRIAFKPVPTIKKPQAAVTIDEKPTVLEATGRHDPCVVPRAVPIVNAMAAIVIMNFWLKAEISRKT